MRFSFSVIRFFQEGLFPALKPCLYPTAGSLKKSGLLKIIESNLIKALFSNRMGIFQKWMKGYNKVASHSGLGMKRIQEMDGSSLEMGDKSKKKETA